CQGFVDAILEGLKYVYLNPEKSVELHMKSVKELQGGSPLNQKVIEYGQAVGTALGAVESFKLNGLGYMDPALIATTVNTVKTYMDAKNVPELDKLYTNQFVGRVKLTEAEWQHVETR